MIPVISILGIDSDPELKHAFQDLATALQLHAEFPTSPLRHGAAGIVCLGDSPEPLPAAPTIQFVSGSPPPTDGAAGMLEFTRHPSLPEFLRGSRLPLGKESGWGLIDDKQHGDVVATINGRPVWKISENRGVRFWSVSTPKPRLRTCERLAHHLNGETFLPLLPLYLFLHGLSPEKRWIPPPLRACIVVDDPNLHAPTYGYLDFASLVELARETPFHTAMALIPLDTWWTNAAAAKIFRENPQALSLLVHGNNHLQYELALLFKNGERDALVAQSLSRIQALEDKRNIRVDRIIAPPHGVCAPEMFDALRAGGYEGMTTNRWSLWRHNPPEQLPLNFGLRPADWLGGLPVLNRFRFNSSICAGEFLMAALLGKPIIPYGHHYDFADGMIHVKRIIETVNSLPVRWMSLREILETNYEHHLESGVLHLRLFSRRVKLRLPPDITTIRIEPAPFQTKPAQTFAIAWQQRRTEVSAQTEASDLPSGVELEIRAVDEALNAKHGCRLAGKAPTACLRRLAAEIRDRLKIQES